MLRDYKAFQIGEQAARCARENGSRSRRDARFYRELRDVAVESAQSDVPLSLLLVELVDGPTAPTTAGESERSAGADLLTLLQDGLGPFDRVVDRGPNVCILILGGKTLSDAEHRLDEICQRLQTEPGVNGPRLQIVRIGAAERKDREPLILFVQRLHSLVRAAYRTT